MRSHARNILPLFLFLLCTRLAGVAEASRPVLWGDLESGPHDVGFRLFEERDTSRAISLAGTVAARPIRIYLWYPGTPAPEATRLTFGRYASLADDDIVLTQARARTAFSNRPLARSLGPDGYEALLRQPVRAVEDSPAAAGRFPLIVLGQGLYYESPITHAILAEYLASHGYVVATCPLVGTHSPLVSLDVLDLETQVRDLEFVIGRTRGLPFVDSRRLGVLGFDMGGMAGLILTMRNPDVDAFASLDAGILYRDSLAIPTASPHFDPSMLRVPWFHATQRAFGAFPAGYEGDSLWDTATFADRTLVLIDGVGHADFTSYALIGDRQPVVGYWGPPRERAPANYALLSRYVEAFFAAHLHDDETSRAFLHRDPKEVNPDSAWTIEHRDATKAEPTYSDFLNEALAGSAERTTAIGRGLRGTPSADRRLEPTFLARLGSHLQISWQLEDAGLAVLDLNTGLHPESSKAWASLAEGQAMTGRTQIAVATLRKAIDLDPSNDDLRRFLRWLESRTAD